MSFFSCSSLQGQMERPCLTLLPLLGAQQGAAPGRQLGSSPSALEPEQKGLLQVLKHVDYYSYIFFLREEYCQ